MSKSEAIGDWRICPSVFVVMITSAVANEEVAKWARMAMGRGLHAGISGEYETMIGIERRELIC